MSPHPERRWPDVPALAALALVGCASEAVLHGRGGATGDPADDSGTTDTATATADSGDAQDAWHPYGDAIDGWPDYDCAVPDDGTTEVAVGHLSDGVNVMMEGMNGDDQPQFLYLWMDAWACVGNVECDAGRYDTRLKMSDTHMTTADGGRADGRDGRWLGPHGPLDWSHQAQGGPDALLQLPNQYSVYSGEQGFRTVEASATLCLIRATPRQFAFSLRMVVGAHDAEWVGIGDGSAPVTLVIDVDAPLETQDIVFAVDVDPEHGPTTDNQPDMPCSGNFYGFGYGWSYETAWPWEQLTDSVRQGVYDAGRPCNWMP